MWDDMHGLKLQGATPKTSPAARHYEHDTPPLIETFRYVNVATQQDWFIKFTRLALPGTTESPGLVGHLFLSLYILLLMRREGPDFFLFSQIFLTRHLRKTTGDKSLSTAANWNTFAASTQAANSCWSQSKLRRTHVVSMHPGSYGL